jgi:hypothetical protein
MVKLNGEIYIDGRSEKLEFWKEFPGKAPVKISTLKTFSPLIKIGLDNPVEQNQVREKIKPIGKGFKKRA